jgi:hypothetical protein
VVDRNSQGGWAVYSKFVEHFVRTESVVITFNYDLLLEKLLVDTRDWHMIDGYGIDIPLADEAFPTPRMASKGFTDIPPGGRSKVLLLKLHGSINWGVPTIAVDEGNVIYRRPSGSGECMLHRPIKTRNTVNTYL